MKVIDKYSGKAAWPSSQLSIVTVSESKKADTVDLLVPFLLTPLRTGINRKKQIYLLIKSVVYRATKLDFVASESLYTQYSAGALGGCKSQGRCSSTFSFIQDS